MNTGKINPLHTQKPAAILAAGFSLLTQSYE